MDADDLEWIGSITPDRRDRSLFQAKLLAGALWEASAILIDQLFEDLKGLLKLDRIDRQDIANTFVLSGLPPDRPTTLAAWWVPTRPAWVSHPSRVLRTPGEVFFNLARSAIDLLDLGGELTQ
jgi:hypothetical protein